MLSKWKPSPLSTDFASTFKQLYTLSKSSIWMCSSKYWGKSSKWKSEFTPLYIYVLRIRKCIVPIYVKDNI